MWCPHRSLYWLSVPLPQQVFQRFASFDAEAPEGAGNGPPSNSKLRILGCTVRSARLHADGAEKEGLGLSLGLFHAPANGPCAPPQHLSHDAAARSFVSAGSLLSTLLGMKPDATAMPLFVTPRPTLGTMPDLATASGTCKHCTVEAVLVQRVRASTAL